MKNAGAYFFIFWALLSITEGPADHWIEIVFKEKGKQQKMDDKQKPISKGAVSFARHLKIIRDWYHWKGILVNK